MNIEPQYLALIVTILLHAFASVWWASKMNTTMSFLNSSLENISKSLTVNEAIRYTKEEAAKDFSIRDKQLDAVWKKVDGITLHNG